MAKLSETVVLLGQAVISADDEAVVSIVNRIGKEPAEISKVVEAIPVQQIIPFLQVIENLLREETITDIRPWITWLNTIFRVHASYLSSISDLNEKLGHLTEWMHERTKNLDKLLQLQGKLELIAQQMRRSAETKKFVEMEPVMTFEE